ncbi:MAG: hypothetical protein Q8O63_06505 [Hoeflea sp.]|nr:hypothetical protein [Hoeflea sp.]
MVDVSSIKISRANALLKKRRRRSIQRSRAWAISGRNCSLALRLFFMAQPKPVEKPADGRAVHINATHGKFNTEFVQRHFAIRSDAGANPFAMRRQLAARRMPLPCRRKRAGGAMPDHHVVDKPRGHPEMPSRLPMAVAFLYKPNDTRTQLDRMRLAHGGSPSMGKVNHKSTTQGIPNLKSCDVL